MQGYYFSRPLPAEQIDLLLRKGTLIHHGKICDPVALVSGAEHDIG